MSSETPNPLRPGSERVFLGRHQSGESTNSSCDRFAISKGGVLKLLAYHGIEMRQQPMTSQEKDLAVRLYVADGLSIRTISQQLGKSKGSVWKELHERDVPTRPAH